MYFFSISFFLFISFFTCAQFDSNTLDFSKNKNPLNFKVTPKSLLESPKEKTNYLEIPKEKWDITKEKKYNKGNIITEKMNSKEGDGLPVSAFRKNQNFGDIRLNSKFVSIICRDHQAVDGDIVDILVNDVHVGRVFLDASYKSFKVPLKEGFNKVDFKAVNVGLSYPNTAELIVGDGEGEVLMHNQWMLDVGFKASVIIIKE